jgi:hypothetical protein
VAITERSSCRPRNIGVDVISYQRGISSNHLLALAAAAEIRLGVHWLICACRRGNGPPLLSISNVTPVLRDGYWLGVHEAGKWCSLLDTDASCYGGSGYTNVHETTAQPTPWHDQPASSSICRR